VCLCGPVRMCKCYLYLWTRSIQVRGGKSGVLGLPHRMHVPASSARYAQKEPLHCTHTMCTDRSRANTTSPTHDNIVSRGGEPSLSSTSSFSRSITPQLSGIPRCWATRLCGGKRKNGRGVGYQEAPARSAGKKRRLEPDDETNVRHL
jgi:hypothetical protein